MVSPEGEIGQHAPCATIAWNAQPQLHAFHAYQLQAYANQLANAQSDAELAKHVTALLAAEGIAAPSPAIVMIAHDTRPSGPELADAAAAGVRCLGGEPQMCGLLTTPQLHWRVMRRNLGQPAGEADYYAALAGAYAQLVAGTQPLEQVIPAEAWYQCLQDAVHASTVVPRRL
jgi:hypothetical protein